MPYQFTIPFQAFRVPLKASEGHYFMPLGKNYLKKFGGTFAELEDEYSRFIQKEIMSDGAFSGLIQELYPLLTQKDNLVLTLPASEKGGSHPELELTIEFFYGSVKGGFWGVAPAVGIEASAPTLEGLEAQFIEIMHFKRKSVPQSDMVQYFLHTNMNQGITLCTGNLRLSAPSLEELSMNDNETASNFLQEVSAEFSYAGDPVFGLDKELQQVIKAFRGGYGRSILVVGPEGSGKTALIAEAAKLFRQHQFSGGIFATTANMLVQGLTMFFGWEFNISFFCKELQNSSSWLYVRNFAELFEVGRYEGNEISIGQYLRNHLSRGEISLLSECTPEELQYIESQNPNISSLFSIVRVFPPRPEALEEVIRAKISLLAENGGVEVTSAAIREAIRLHNRYNPYSGIPGRVIRFFERILATSEPSQSPQLIGIDHVIDLFCAENHIPPVLVAENVPFVLEKVEAFFQDQVFGQEAAVSSVVSMLVKEKMRLSGTHKPVASFLFVGPTGVGKTELAKVLTSFVYGDVSRITRFDMSEYAGADAVFRLTGIGDTEGLLTSAVRRAPFSVLLFDEIEKAHPDFFRLLLQILDQGRLTDFRGNLVNFCSTIIIMTSNIGADSLKIAPIQMTRPAYPEEDLQNHYKRAVEKKFPPELVNRFDEIIPFASLTPASIKHVVNREIESLMRRDGIRHQPITITIEDEVSDYLAHIGFHPLYGARFLQRAVHNEIVLPLAKALQAREYYEKTEVHIRIDSHTGKPDMQVFIEETSIFNFFERLSESNNIDWISQLRRKIYKLKHSSLFREATLRLRNLRNERNLPENKHFWRHDSKAQEFAALESFFEQFKRLSDSIQSMELDVFVDYFEGQSKNEWLEKYLPGFEEEILALVKKLYAIIHPEYEKAEIVVLGRNLPQVVDFYQDLFTRHHLNWKVVQIWNSRGKPSPDNSSKKAPDPFIKGTTEVVFDFIEKHQDYYTKYNVDLDELVGLMFSLSGEGIYAKVKQESGIHLFESEEGFQERYCVVVSDKPQFTDIADYVKDVGNPHKRPRRIIKATGGKDLTYKIEEDSIPELVEALSKKWEKLLEAEVLDII